MTLTLVIGTIAVTSAGAGGRAESDPSHHRAGLWTLGVQPADQSSEVAYWHRLAVKRLRLLGARERRITHLLARIQRLKSRHGSSTGVDACLHELIQRESHWNVHATNPTTGAYGLPQALPGSKMSSAGPDWRDSAATQIRWMRGYIAGRYGSTCAALSFQKAYGYY